MGVQHYRNNLDYVKMLKLVKNSSKHVCYFCHKKLANNEITVDHLTPLGRGGKTEPSNLVICCDHCNNEKHDMTEAEYKEYKKPKFYEETLCINDIIIPRVFMTRPVRKAKVQKVINYYNQYKCFDKPLTIKTHNGGNLLIDGYSRYIVAKMLNIDNVPVIYS